MELAYQYRSGHRDGDELHDLVLLDTETGQRRRLVAEVTWPTPRWSADGRRVRFEQRPPGGGFEQRELDVDTGEIRDVDNDTPDGAGLPGFSGHGVRSPAGRWIAYQHHSSVLCVARTDEADAFALTLPFQYVGASAYWSPCGTKLAVHLTAQRDSGAYVIDLRTGRPRRICPGPGNRGGGWPNFHVSGWSPDGRWVAATKTRWHDPKTYDYEWRELWLLAANGLVIEQLTDDGRCQNPAIRPAGEPPAVNGEDALTFAWARRLRGTGDENVAGEALAAQVRLDPAAGPPFAVVVMVRTPDGLRYPSIDGCESIPEAFEKLDAFLAPHRYRPAGTFTVVYPRYATDGQAEELTVLRLAHLVLAETGKRLWQFDRDVPAPPVP